MLKKKAAENYKIALIARSNGCTNAAASRIYYAFYQAGVAELTERGITPFDFNQNVARDNEFDGTNPWKHGMFYRAVRHPQLGLSRKLQDIVQRARALRELGDYDDTDSVKDYDLEVVFHHAPDILDGWGVAGVWYD